MRKLLFSFVLAAFMCVLSSAGMHKFYMAVFQVEYSPAKKQLQITGRIFMDDLDKALYTKYGKKFYLGTPRELPETTETLKHYFADKISFKVNGKPADLAYFDREADNDQLVCYFTVATPKTVTSIEVRNTLLFELFREQQNMINTNIYKDRKSMVLTYDKPSGVLNY